MRGNADVRRSMAEKPITVMDRVVSVILPCEYYIGTMILLSRPRDRGSSHISDYRQLAESDEK